MWIVAGVLGMLPDLALAAPYTGVGHAPADQKDARAAALLRARRAALRAALDQVIGSTAKLPDEAKGKRGSAWTSAYRVLSQTQDGATITIEVEVEIDTGRLINRYRPKQQAPIAGFYAEEVVALNGCDESVRPQLTQALLDRGAIGTRTDGTPIRIEIQCQDLGEVSFLQQYGSRIQVIVRDRNDSALAAGAGVGFAEDMAAAVSNASAQAAIDITRKLEGQAGDGVLVYLSDAWPAARVRRLERALQTSLVGARSVALRGLSGAGAAIVRVVGPFDAEALAKQLPAIQVPGGQLRVEAIDSPRSLRVRIVDPELVNP